MVPLIVVGFQLLPVEDAYCTDQLETVTGAEVGLKSSMKSLRQVAPALPPAPYIWLMTRCDTPAPGVPVAVGSAGVSVGVGVLVTPGTRVAVLVGVRVLVGVLVGVPVGVPAVPPPAIHSVPLGKRMLLSPFGSVQPLKQLFPDEQVPSSMAELSPAAAILPLPYMLRATKMPVLPVLEKLFR
jgi:hypothetical protein